MKKILVDVTCPVTAKRYNMYIPCNLVIGEIKYLIAGIIEKNANTKFFLENQVILCDYCNGKRIDDGKTPKELNLKNGSQLILI